MKKKFTILLFFSFLIFSFLIKSMQIPSGDIFNLKYSKKLLKFSKNDFLKSSEKIKNLYENLKKNLKKSIKNNNFLISRLSFFKNAIGFLVKIKKLFKNNLKNDNFLSIWNRGCFSISFSRKAQNFLKNQSFKIEYQLTNLKGILDNIVDISDSKKIFKFTDESLKKNSGFFILRSYLGSKLIIESNSATNFTGDIFSIFFNQEGINKPGNPFGFFNKLTVTRVYPINLTRAMTINPNSFNISKNQFWKVNINIDIIIQKDKVGKENYFLFPSLTSIELSKEFEDIILQNIYEIDFNYKKIIINLNNLDEDCCYPNFKEKSFWSDINEN